MSKVRASLLLHKRDASPPSCAVMMLGHILGIQFQYREPNLLALEHKGPEYKKLPTLLYGLQGPTATHLATINESYEALEAYLTRSEYVAADHLTLADLSLVSTVAAMQVIHKLESDRFPRSSDWVSRLEAESFFKEVNAPGAAAFAKLMKVFWEKNRSKK